MALPHGRRQPRLPGAVELAETAIAVAVGVDGAMLLPQQLQRHPWPAQLAVDCRPVRPRPTILGRDRRRRVEPALQRFVASALPAAARRGRHAAPAGCIPRRPSRSPRGWRRSCVWTCRRRTASARRGSCAWVISVQACPAPVERSEAMPIRGSPNGAVTPVHRLVAIARNGWSRSIGTAGRNQSE